MFLFGKKKDTENEKEKEIKSQYALLFEEIAAPPGRKPGTPTDVEAAKQAIRDRVAKREAFENSYANAAFEMEITYMEYTSGGYIIAFGVVKKGEIREGDTVISLETQLETTAGWVALENTDLDDPDSVGEFIETAKVGDEIALQLNIRKDSGIMTHDVLFSPAKA